jgi:hypothetical protein
VGHRGIGYGSRVEEGDLKAPADAIYVERVRRARALTIGERIDTSIELF